MATVILSGWNDGFNKVRVNQLLRKEAGYGLKEAKSVVDRLLAGKAVRVELPDDDSTSAFCANAQALGAVCHFDPEPQATAFDEPSPVAKGSEARDDGAGVSVKK